MTRFAYDVRLPRRLSAIGARYLTVHPGTRAVLILGVGRNERKPFPELVFD